MPVPAGGGRFDSREQRHGEGGVDGRFRWQRMHDVSIVMQVVDRGDGASRDWTCRTLFRKHRLLGL